MSQLLQGQAVGVHLLVNVYDVSDVSLLEYLTRGRPLLDQIVQIMQLHVMSQTGHQFQPKGYTYAYVLSESHFTIHTYPEHRSCYIDLFCCHPEFNPIQAIHLIKRMFHTEHVRYQIVPR
jgi:S-adenosylmethionine decarboxylase proenzyme